MRRLHRGQTARYNGKLVKIDRPVGGNDYIINRDGRRVVVSGRDLEPVSVKTSPERDVTPTASVVTETGEELNYESMSLEELRTLAGSRGFELTDDVEAEDIREALIEDDKDLENSG